MIELCPKHVWRTPLPEKLELYNIKDDPSETKDLAAQHPDLVASLKQRSSELAGRMEKPLLLQTEFQAVLERLAMPPAFPKQ